MRSTGDEQRLEQGQRLGRYLILSTLGDGPSGVVYAAYDPEADRKVALKLLRPAGEGAARAEALATEARNVARLAHPNVVRVLDVGRHGADCFVVMEFVRGLSLDAWLARAGAHWRPLLEVVRQAGRGLAAAHRAGLVHRGLKPQNILVGEDGRVRVTDIGLTRTLEPEARAGAADPAVLGYLAPEQLAGERADALSDQFALCATLYEALYGVRPFAGAGPGELRAAIAAGRLQTPLRSAIVPAWLREAVLRGLQAEPRRRFASLDALLDGLTPAPRRRRRWLLATGLVALGCLGALLALSLGLGARPDCPDAAVEAAGLWDPARQAAGRTAFAASGRAHAPATWERVRAVLAAWAGRWGEARRQTCLAAGPGARCLAVRRAEFEALTGALESADGPVVDRAAQAVDALGDPGACLAAGAPGGEPPAEPREDGVRAELGRVRALCAIGRGVAAWELAERALGEARQLARPELVSAALLERALTRRAAGPATVQGQDADLEDAQWEALAGRDLAGAAAAAVARVELAADAGALGTRQRSAEALLRGLAGASPREARRLEADLAEGLGRAEARLGRLGPAAEAYTRALGLREQLHGPQAWPVAEAARALADVLDELGRGAEALAHRRRALEAAEANLGPEHLALLDFFLPWASGLRAAGRLQESLEVATRAAALAEAALGPADPRALRAAVERGRALQRLGLVTEARPILERALGALANPTTVGLEGEPEALEALGCFGLEAGDLEAALAALELALASRRAVQGEDSPDTGRLRVLLGDARRLRGELPEAFQEYQGALACLERALGAAHPALAAPLLGLGRVHLVQGQADAAVAPLERALELRERAAGEPRGLAEARFALARALLRARPGERARARSLAEAARADFAAEGEADQAAEVQRFLASAQP
ncbi:MAG TPA: serine/threonine-protein kinase [Myxococcota bacterium]|nr:serine/threonine-protein kinase [Myxococcota bacterium]HRY94953.1 serine/threonine-protein kinase [Myxococcota bacterium]HSA19984.1 serine/threonine-protein kinase [Myxococcota bacterium]